MNDKPFEIDCKERVAYDLMQLIGSRSVDEDNHEKPTVKDYYLNLYAECLRVVDQDSASLSIE
ncbi:MAG: hypothetical protein NVS3B3_17260 [Aquirhabdus sp.]